MDRTVIYIFASLTQPHNYPPLILKGSYYHDIPIIASLKIFRSTICITISLQPTVWILRFNELRNFNYIYPPWSQSVPMLFILVVPPETLYMFFLPLLLLTVTYIFIHEQIKFLLVIIIFIDNILLNFSNT